VAVVAEGSRFAEANLAPIIFGGFLGFEPSFVEDGALIACISTALPVVSVAAAKGPCGAGVLGPLLGVAAEVTRTVVAEVDSPAQANLAPIVFRGF
jgi:hypothetical protein